MKERTISPFGQSRAWTSRSPKKLSAAITVSANPRAAVTLRLPALWGIYSSKDLGPFVFKTF